MKTQEKVIAVKIPVKLDREIEKYAAYHGMMKREVIIGFLAYALSEKGEENA